MLHFGPWEPSAFPSILAAFAGTTTGAKWIEIYWGHCQVSKADGGTLFPSENWCLEGISSSFWWDRYFLWKADLNPADIVQLISDKPPKSNIASETWWLVDYCPFFCEPAYFQGRFLFVLGKVYPPNFGKGELVPIGTRRNPTTTKFQVSKSSCCRGCLIKGFQKGEGVVFGDKGVHWEA